MYNYTLGFLIHKNQILMLNRNKSPWMGAWNGLGGKINPNESPKACIQREVYEETGLNLALDKFIYKGDVTWNTFHANGQGLYIYIYYLEDDFTFETPKRVDEGILDFKDISWLCDYNNEGLAKNIPYFLPSLLEDELIYEHHCTFEGNILKEVNKKRLKICQNLL